MKKILLSVRGHHWLFLLAGIPLGGLAAPGKLADIPLFLGTGTKPNIMLIVDDSGSMDWEVLQSNRAKAIHGSTADTYLYYPPISTSETLALCPGYNVMAYDPNIVYTPWKGTDKNGQPYTNRSLTTALSNPYEGGPWVDISHQYYITWDDSDGDGLYDSGECATSVSSYGTSSYSSTYYSGGYYPYGSYSYGGYSSYDPYSGGYSGYTSYSGGYYGCYSCYSGGTSTSTSTSSSSGSQVIRVSSLSDGEKTNYANWYTYHRNKEYVVKWALSNIISVNRTRIGLATLHNNNAVGTEIKDIDNFKVPLDPATQANKNALMKNLFRIASNGGTPLREALYQAGQYFEMGVYPSTSFLGFTPSTSSPILPASDGGQCQQNFAVLMSDGNWNGPSAFVGNTDSNTSNPYDGGSFADSYSDTLADVAMHYYKRDLAPALDNKVATTPGVDENTAQHMVTYTVAFGVDGTLSDSPTDTTTPFAWPVPVIDTPTTIDDMRHAAWNGRGKFLDARNPSELVSAFDAAIMGISGREGVASALAFNTTNIESGTRLFQAQFNSAGWSGTLKAIDFSSSSLGSEVWDANTLLNQRDLQTSPRQIATYNGSQGVAFRFPSNYTAPSGHELALYQLNDLLTNAPFSANTSTAAEITDNQAFGEKLVDYLRGDATHEGASNNLFRQRLGHRLGDITHSSPTFVGAPGTHYPDAIEGIANLYSDFILARLQRPGMVYVGSNDGILHGFDAATGRERFGYIPGFIFSSDNTRGLHYLAQQDYAHKPYVDGSPQAGDVFIDGAWATYLVGGVRGGGKGIYVLDITNPATMTEANASTWVKQEFTHPDLGHTFSRPVIAKLNNGKWAAIFGNGYNNDPTGDGAAKLFLLYLDGSGFHLINTHSGSVANADCADAASECNGLSSPKVVDLNGDGIIDRVYAGDLLGHLWAFDLSGSSASSWQSAYNASSASGGRPKPLFIACSATTCTSNGKAINRQPITTQPEVMPHPLRRGDTTEPNLLVYVPTGQYLTEGDNATTDVQSMYGVWDAGSQYTELTRHNLQVQVISQSGSVAGGRVLTQNPVNYVAGSGGAKMGWYIDFPEAGERGVQKASVVGDLLFFNTMNPVTASCIAEGKGHLMFVDKLTGGQPGFTVLDVNNDGYYNDLPIAGYLMDAIPGESRVIDNLLVTPDTNGTVHLFGVQVQPLHLSGRTSWGLVH